MVDLNGKGAFDYAHVVIPGLSTMPNGIAWFGGALYIASLEKYQNCRVRRQGPRCELHRSSSETRVTSAATSHSPPAPPPLSPPAAVQAAQRRQLCAGEARGDAGRPRAPAR